MRVVGVAMRVIAKSATSRLKKIEEGMNEYSKQIKSGWREEFELNRWVLYNVDHGMDYSAIYK